MVHIGSLSACLLHARLRAHINFMHSHAYMSTGRFLHSPGHDCMNAKVSGADTIASETGLRQHHFSVGYSAAPTSKL